MVLSARDWEGYPELPAAVGKLLSPKYALTKAADCVLYSLLATPGDVLPIIFKGLIGGILGHANCECDHGSIHIPMPCSDHNGDESH